MLDQQDIEVMKKVVKTETSDLRQDVSILKQDVTVLKQDVSELKQDMTEVKGEIKDLRRHMLVLHEDTKNEFKLLLENVGSVVKEAISPVHQHVFNNHEPRIASLELAVKRKKSA